MFLICNTNVTAASNAIKISGRARPIGEYDGHSEQPMSAKLSVNFSGKLLRNTEGLRLNSVENWVSLTQKMVNLGTNPTPSASLAARWSCGSRFSCLTARKFYGPIWNL